ncbi:MAG: twitch domain-containing radical SAM protein, partial [Pseudomonadota bacterium]
IYFAGGEPLIMDEHYALLRLLHDRGQTGIKLSYNTNLSTTRFAGQSIFELWAKFENLDITASIDAAGARGAYVRSGFNWDTFVRNVQELRTKCPHAKLQFGITVSALNILTLTDLFCALESQCNAVPADFHLHSLQDPAHYRTQVLPAHIKQNARARIEDYITEKSRASDSIDDFVAAARGITDYMDACDLSGKLPDLRDITDQLDSLRSENVAVSLPELVPALEGAAWWKKPWLALRQRLSYAMR